MNIEKLLTGLSIVFAIGGAAVSVARTAINVDKDVKKLKEVKENEEA